MRPSSSHAQESSAWDLPAHRKTNRCFSQTGNAYFSHIYLSCHHDTLENINAATDILFCSVIKVYIDSPEASSVHRRNCINQPLDIHLHSKSFCLLLSHPGSRLCGVVNEKGSSIGSTADLPTSWQEARFTRGLGAWGVLRSLLQRGHRWLGWCGGLGWTFPKLCCYRCLWCFLFMENKCNTVFLDQ